MPPACPVDDLIVESIRFLGDRYRLEGELVYPEERSPTGAVVLAGPHPLLGGNMHNNVVRSLGDGLARRGLVSLRFNYRGVGGSQGPITDVVEHVAQFWQTSCVAGESEYHRDLQAAIAFVRSAVNPDLRLALVGYSFGCTLLARCLPTTLSPIPLVLIAPTLAKHDYESLQPVPHSKLVIASEDDFATDASRLHQWFERLRPPKELIHARFDSHFFRGHEEWLVETVGNYLDVQWRS